MLKVPYCYRVVEYELSDVLVKVEGDVEHELGVIFPFGEIYESLLPGYGYVSRGGFETFSTKQEAVDCLIETYEGLIENRRERDEGN